MDIKSETNSQFKDQATNNRQPPKTPKWLIWLFILVLLACAVILAATLKSNFAAKSAIKTNQTHNLTVAETKGVLFQHQKITFPNIATSTNTSLDRLPKDFLPLIISDASDIQAQTLTYENGKQGYRVVYTATSSVADLSQLLVNKPLAQFTFLDSLRGNLAAMFEKQNNSYQVRVLMEFVSDRESRVTISIISL